MTYRQLYSCGIPMPAMVADVHVRHCIAAIGDFGIPVSVDNSFMQACPYKHADADIDPEVCRKCWDAEMEEQV